MICIFGIEKVSWYEGMQEKLQSVAVRYIYFEVWLGLIFIFVIFQVTQDKKFNFRVINRKDLDKDLVQGEYYIKCELLL